MDVGRMKELMVGREIAENYYRPDFAPDYQDEVVLRAENIHLPELRGVGLELHKGEILGIGGLSESGMHELGRILFGIEPADRGSVTVAATGDVITSPRQAIKNAIGYLSKNRDTEALILNYSIGDNICLPSLSKLSRGVWISPGDERKLAEKWSGELAIKMRSTRAVLLPALRRQQAEGGAGQVYGKRFADSHYGLPHPWH